MEGGGHDHGLTPGKLGTMAKPLLHGSPTHEAKGDTKPCPPLQVEHRRHHVHAAGWLAALLAPEANADVEDDRGWQIPVWLTGVG